MSFLRRSLVLCRPAIGNGDTREIKQRRDRGVDPAWVDSIARKPGEIDETVSHSIAYFFFFFRGKSEEIGDDYTLINWKTQSRKS